MPNLPDITTLDCGTFTVTFARDDFASLSVYSDMAFLELKSGNGFKASGVDSPAYQALVALQRKLVASDDEQQP